MFCGRGALRTRLAEQEREQADADGRRGCPGQVGLVAGDSDCEEGAGAETGEADPAAARVAALAEQGREDVQGGTGDGERQEPEREQVDGEERRGGVDPAVGQIRRGTE